jgi:predicted dehydrogenase
MAFVGSLGGLWSPDRIVADTPWRHHKLEGGGGGSIDIGVHQFHLLRYVFGEVAWVSGTARMFEPLRYKRSQAGDVIATVEANVDDTYLATAGFENEAIGQLMWSWAGGGEALEFPGAPAFLGSEGCIKGGDLIDRNGTHTPLAEAFRTGVSADERERFFPYGLTDPFALQQLDWLRSIEEGKDPETSGREGLHDLACAFAMLESSQAARQVSLDEVLSGAVDGYQAEINAHYGL